MRPTPSEFQDAWPRIVRALASFTGSLDDGEEYAAEAVARAAAYDGPVDELAAWCITVGKRAWLDEARRRAVHDRLAPELVTLATSPDVQETAVDPTDPAREGLDDRLALLFVACDEELSPSLQMVLALRVVCGLTTARIAHHLGIQESAAAARLTRAKTALAAARGEFRTPDATERAARLPVVLACVAGMFTVAHRTVLDPVDALADTGRAALSIADALVAAYPHDTEVRGLRAVIRLGLARRPGRLDTEGVALPMDEVDRRRWDVELWRGGLDDATFAMSGDGRFALEAAISGLHSHAASVDGPDWVRLVTVYRALEERWPAPSVTVARLVAEAHAVPADDLPAVEEALAELVEEAPAYAGRDAELALADLEWRTGRQGEAAARYAALAEVLDVEPLRRFCLKRAGLGRLA
ncbi:hypothetical protein EKO23_17735 [Nocardioides guangzhouensis]|uniref:Uncharacterized protein n=1 Tax=Nocardioides guangzhouensis TaxID=2497878 RepID=A0A4Q4Z8P4_9ACTN|nr:DUF6596 domain-containing protein [Nocardioides guangzhouensis]RYP83918.1 hypothetical protein EKO23_17735 [Nocardioides guangzhouensis]